MNHLTGETRRFRITHADPVKEFAKNPVEIGPFWKGFFLSLALSNKRMELHDSIFHSSSLTCRVAAKSVVRPFLREVLEL